MRRLHAGLAVLVAVIAMVASGVDVDASSDLRASGGAGSADQQQTLQWVLVETRVNPDNHPTEFVSGVTPNYFGEPRFDGKFDRYTITATSISSHHRDVDYGVEAYNMTTRVDLDTPPAVLIPGEAVTLNASGSASGANNGWNPGEQFEFRGDGVSFEGETYFSFGLNPQYGPSTGSVAPRVTAPSATRAGAEIRIRAFYWNCAACLVEWVYRADVGPPATSTDGAPAAGTEPAGTGTGAGGGIIPGASSAPPPFGTAEPANVARMTIQAGQRQVVAGDTVWVPVYLLRGDDVANLNYEISYDSAVADATGGNPVAGSLLGGRLFRANPGDPRIVKIGFAGTDGVSGAGTVTWIPFRAVGRPGDRTPLTVTVSTINHPDGTVPAIDRIHGQVIITDAGGLVPGDCDGDGAVTEFDARCALEISVQLRPPIPALDMNADSDITSRDATLILQRATGRT